METLNLDGLRFKSIADDPSAPASDERVIRFVQEGNIICGTYTGPQIAIGYAIGKVIGESRGFFEFVQIGLDSVIESGSSALIIGCCDEDQLQITEHCNHHYAAEDIVRRYSQIL